MSLLSAPRRLGVVFFPAYDWAISPTHPERQERLLYTQDQLREEGLFDIEGIQEYKPRVATAEDVERVHFVFPDLARVATTSHMISTGGAIRAGRLVREGKADKAFALVRPPGHHAMSVVHGARGFCTINIEAVMVEHLRETYGVRRVAIVDTDCHHGDGTQDIFWHDPDVLFISLHQDGRTLYPGTGFPKEMGGPGALGTTCNIPLLPGTGDEGFLHMLDHVVLPLLERFKPELVINSAGQDNHYSDPITSMAFSARGYAELTRRLNPDIAVLEGGYSIQGALPYVNLGICLALAGLDFDHVREPDYDAADRRQPQKITDYTRDLADQLLEFFANPPSLPRDGRMEGGWFTRDKEIFHDTDGIREHQVERVLLCGDCPGTVVYESRSTANPPCLGVRIPARACVRCQEEGHKVFVEGQSGRGFGFAQLIDRVNRRVQRVMI